MKFHKITNRLIGKSKKLILPDLPDSTLTSKFGNYFITRIYNIHQIILQTPKTITTPFANLILVPNYPSSQLLPTFFNVLFKNLKAHSLTILSHYSL